MESVDIAPGTRFKDVELDKIYTVVELTDSTVVLEAEFEFYDGMEDHAVELLKSELNQRIDQKKWKYLGK